MSDTLHRLYAALSMGSPYQWQLDTFAAFSEGTPPAAIKAPTGAGKTAAMVCWVAALADQAIAGRVTLQRRYLVAINRRALVDAASDLAMRLVQALELPELADIRTALSALSASGKPLSVSTIRGQRADACEWATDPSMPAIIAATPDMVGSRVLFGGYGLGRSRRATHAGLLGVDTLVVHDEAHLSPALTVLLRTVEAMAAPGSHLIGRPPMVVAEMTATPRGLPAGRAVIACDPASSPDLLRRMSAVKRLSVTTGGIAGMVKHATKAAQSGRAVVVYITSPDDAGKVATGIRKAGIERVGTLTGTMRGHERDALVQSEAFARLLPVDGRPRDGAVLVATAAGEIGIDIDADVLLCDAATLDRMAQRAGRCNRRGLTEGEITVYADASKPSKDLDDRIALSMSILAELPAIGGALDASPIALSGLLAHARYADAIDPAPETRELVRDVVDLYALTSHAREVAQPDRGLYIHGIRKDEPEISFAWRHLPAADHAEWLTAWPLSGRELARLPLPKAEKLVARLASIDEGISAVIAAADGETIDVVTAGEYSRRLHRLRDGDTIIMSVHAGGLASGIPDPSAADLVSDVSGEHTDARGHERMSMGTLAVQYRNTDAAGPEWSHEGGHYDNIDALLSAALPGWQIAFHDAPKPIEAWAGTVRYWPELPGIRSADDGDDAALARCDRLLTEHHELTGKAAARLVTRLPMHKPFGAAITAGGPRHDDGKARECWQAAIGNEGAPLAKSASPWFDLRASAGYRHELGSVVGAGDWSPLQRHIVAAHHGWARPGYSPAALAHDACLDAGIRAGHDFASLHDAIGPWALAYVEAVLKGADILAEVLAVEMRSDLPADRPSVGSIALSAPALKTWHASVNPRNPAEFFACLGLASLARNLSGACVSLEWSAGAFTLHGVDTADVQALLARLCSASVEVDGAEDDKWPALVLACADGARLPLHPWVSDAGGGASEWKWSVGNTDGTAITRTLLRACGELLTTAGDVPLFAQGSGMARTDAATAKYRIDAAGSWSAVDVGYSLEKEGTPKSSRPWVELLSVIGVQSFAPPPAGTDGWTYATWTGALPYMVALAACKGMHPSCDRSYIIATAKSGKNTDALLSTPTDLRAELLGVEFA